MMLSTEGDETGFEQRFWSRDLHAMTPELTAEDFNDAIDELQSLGLVKAHQVIGNTPYYFADVVATYALYLHFKDEGLDYDPMNDIKAVAAAVAAKGSVEGKDLSNLVPISPGRLNRAVAYLEDYGHVQVFRTLGTAPYDFRHVEATRHTRRFVKENCN